MRTLTIIAISAALGWTALAQTPVQPINDAPNPYQAVDNYFKLPEGRSWGSLSTVEPDLDGRSMWVAERCGANTCVGSNLPVVLKFDPSGQMVASFGAGMFAFPHGIHVDRQGNVWVVDGQPPGGAGRGRGAAAPASAAGSGASALQASPAPPPSGLGHSIVKFSPEGKVLLRLGTPGVIGKDATHFNQPSDVITAANGDIFVADGHGGETNTRIVKYTRDGKFIKEWGTKGTGPGELDTPHALAMDSKGRLFVADRNNNRIQIFDQEGKFLEEWKQFSRPSGVYIDRNDTIYVADSESNKSRKHGEWKRGIRIGSARDGKVVAFIPDTNPNADEGPLSGTSGPEGVAADAQGNVYGAEVGQRGLKKYVRR
jgi:NHL repeat